MRSRGNYNRAIVDAAGLPDPVEGMNLLSGFLETNARGGPGAFPRPQLRSHQLLLAGLLARNGHFSQACLVLGQRPDHPVDTTADALVVDPGLWRMQGHHYNTNVFYRRLLDAAGLSSQVLRAQQDDESMTHDNIGTIPTFVVPPYVGLFRQPMTGDHIEVINRLFLLEFERKLPRMRPRLTIAHTCRHTFVDGLCAYLARCDQTTRSSLLLGIIEAHTFDPSHALHDAVRNIYRRAFGRLASVEGLRVMIVTETENTADTLADLSGGRFDVSVVPHVAAFLSEARAIRPQGAGDKPVIGYVGQTRPDRGPNLIPDIASRTLRRLGENHRWRVQFNVSMLQKLMSESEKLLLDALIAGDSFELAGATLPLSDYYRLMQSLDIVVLPYNSRYETTGSGVAIECINMGCVQVVPKGSSMERLARAHGAGVVTFDDMSPEAISDAVCKAIAQLDELKKRSITAANLQDAHAVTAVKNFIEDA